MSGDFLADDLDTWFDTDDFGEVVTLDPSGASVEVNCLYDQDYYQVDAGFAFGEVESTERTVHLKTSDVEDNNVDIETEVLVGGVLYRVGEIRESHDLITVMLLKRINP